MSRIVVVGAGVIGIASAHYLQQAGHEVTLIDRGTVGGGCSQANCGYVCPSHVLPLAGPGMIWAGLKTLFARNSPLKIRPRFDLPLWAWLARFARRCNRTDMLASGHKLQILLTESRRLYDELFAAEPLEAEWQTRGLLFVFRSPAALRHYALTDELLRREFGVGADRYDGPDVARLEPALIDGLAGGFHYPLDAHLRPDALLCSWRQLIESRGAIIRERCDFHNFVERGQRAVAIQTSLGKISADAVVIAAGAWTPQLAKHLGTTAGIVPGKGYSITMPRPEHCPTLPLIFEEDRVAVTPFATGFRIGSTMEFAGYDATLPPERLELLRAGARRYLRTPLAKPEAEPWWGWRPMTADGLPVIAPCPRLPNVIVAAGHGMLGVTLAPATGERVTNLVATALARGLQ